MASTAVSFLSNTGAALLPGGIVFMNAVHLSFNGETEEQLAEWDITLPNGGTWTAVKYPGTVHATPVDVLTDIKGWSIPVLPEEAGTLAATTTGRGGDGTISVSPEGSVTIAALSGYTNKLYLDVDGAATSGLVVEDSFDDSDSVAIADHEPDTNNWIHSWVVSNGTWEIQNNLAEAQTTDGAGRGIVFVDAYTTSYVVSTKINYPSAITESALNRDVAGVVFRRNNSVNYLVAGYDRADGINRIRIEKVVAGIHTSLAVTSAAIPALDTDHEIIIRNIGDDIELWVSSSAIDIDVDTPTLTVTDTTHNTETLVGFGGKAVNVGASRGPVYFTDFTLTTLSGGNGTSLVNAVTDIDVMSRILDHSLDKVLIYVAQGTYQPTQTIGLHGINVWYRWETSGDAPTLDCASLPLGTPLFTLGTGSFVSRRLTTQGFDVVDTSIVRTEFDASDSGVVVLANETIAVDSVFYAAATTGDPVRYMNDLGTVVTGLVVATQYYIIKVSTDIIALATSEANAGTDTRVNLTALSDGAVQSLLLNGGRKIYSMSTRDIVDLGIVDVDMPLTTPKGGMTFVEDTSTSTSRMAFIRCNKSNYINFRYTFGVFGTGTAAYIDNGSGGSFGERPCRCTTVDALTVAYNNWSSPEYSGKNPLRIPTCAKAVVYGNRLVGNWCSTGGDGGNPKHVRFDQNVMHGVNYFKDGASTDSDCFITSNLITDVDLKEDSALAPTGAGFTGFFGCANGSGGDADRVRFVHNTLSVEAGLLALSGNRRVGFKVDAAIVCENNILAYSAPIDITGSVQRPTSSSGLGNSINNIFPEDAESTNDSGTAANITDVGNVSEATWIADDGSSGDQFSTIIYDTQYNPSIKDDVTVPTGVHYDFYGRLVTPGDTVWAGAVMSSAPSSVVSKSGLVFNLMFIRKRRKKKYS